MRTRLQTFSVLLLLVLIAGCASDNVGRWRQANAGLIGAQDTLSTLAENGQLSNEEILAANDLVTGARAAIDSAELYLPDGGPQFETLLTIGKETVRSIIRRYDAVEQTRSE